MPLAPDPNPAFGSYAHPNHLVTTEWLSANLGAGGLRIVEANEEPRLYDIGHIPGAVKIDGRAELGDELCRDYLDGARFTELMRAKGIARDDTVVLYGDRGNSLAAHAAWIFGLFGHPDVRLLDGGRDAWISEARDTTFDAPSIPAVGYPAVERDDGTARAFRDDVLRHLGRPLVDVRSPAEYAGAETHEPDRSGETALRGGHIPTAVNIPWTEAIGLDGRFRPRADLDRAYAAVAGADDVVVYSRVGERAGHTWFVLAHLLGIPAVRNYDGSWLEWGSAVRMPVARGAEPGRAPLAGTRRNRR
ncbi:sulfurtransferase [Nocardia asteroides]|uniref:sulfurtransferase n=1 Tax=Nocardia asteroides TaxID=1824 RepID=UPI001E57D193|nr:sulfurtransferase [Nocardia asteroides]UGT60154.1 sulfurtransferase [Nocardia asteroides]